MALTKFTGFNYGIFSTLGSGLFNTVQGTVAGDTLNTRNGFYCMKITSASGANHQVGWTFAAGSRALTAVFYFKVDVVPSAGEVRPLAQILNAGSNAGFRFRLNGGNLECLPLGTGAGAVRVFGAISSGVWYRLEFKLNFSANPWTCDWRVATADGAGADQTQATVAQAAADLTQFNIGTTADTPATTHVKYYDDVAYALTASVNDAYFGPIQIKGYLPTYDGTHITPGNFTDAGGAISGANPAWDNLDDLPFPTGATQGDHVKQTANNTTNQIETVVDASDDGDALAMIGIIAYHSASTTANEAGTVLYEPIVGGASTTIYGTPGSRQNYAVSSHNYKASVPTGSRLGSDLVAVRFRFGYSNDAAPDPGITAQMIEVLRSVSSGVETTDSDTAYLDFTPDGTELLAKEYTDASTIYFDLTPSASEVAEFVDAATGYLDYTPSSVDEAALTSAGTAYFDFTPSATDILEAVDSAAIYFDFTPSGTEVHGREFSDAATTRLVFTVSATEEAQFTDAASVTLAFTPSIVETHTHEYVDAATARLTFTPSTTEVFEAADAATAYLDFTPATTVEEHTTFDVGTAYLDFTPSGTDVLEPTDVGTAYLNFTPSSVEVSDFADAQTVYVDFTASGSDTAQFVDAVTVTLGFTPSGTDAYGATDTASVYFDYEPSGTESLSGATEDSATIRLTFTPSSTDTIEAVDSGTVYFDLTPSGTDIHGRETSDAATITLDFQPSGIDAATYTDTATGNLTYTPSGTDTLQATEAASVYFDYTPSGSEEYGRVDAATAYFDYTPSAVSVSVFADEATGYVTYTPSGADVVVFADTAVGYLDYTPDGTEEYGGVLQDAATVTLQFTPYLLFDLVGTVTRRWQAQNDPYSGYRATLSAHLDGIVYRRWRLWKR